MRTKKWIFVLLWLVFSLSTGDLLAEEASGPSQGNKDGVYLHEIGFGSGYAWGNLKEDNPDDFAMYLAMLHLGFKLNSLVGLKDHKGTLQLALEPFVNPIVEPDDGVAVGSTVLFQYSYPVFDKLSLYGGFGAAPMYLGVDTVEQGDAGFNFFDQGLVGIQYFLTEDKAINVGYRRFHISNLGIGGGPNGGFNGDLVTVGFSLFY